MGQVDVRITISNGDLSISYSEECGNFAIGVLLIVVENLLRLVSESPAEMTIFNQRYPDGSLMQQESDQICVVQDLQTGEFPYRVAISSVFWSRR